MNDENKVYIVRTIQFRPYPETGEFACIGVVLYSQDGGYFDYMLASGKEKPKVLRRIRGFFPELEPSTFTLALDCVKGLADEIHTNCRQGNLFVANEVAVNDFARARENVIRLGNASVVLCSDPTSELKKQYEYAVMRSFVEKGSVYVVKMQQSIRQCLNRAKIAYENNKKIKIQKYDYSVSAPICRASETMFKIVRPIDLNNRDVQDVLHTVATWSFDARNIKNEMSDVSILCPVLFPTEGTGAYGAARDIMHDNLELFNWVDYGKATHEDEIVGFMR